MDKFKFNDRLLFFDSKLCIPIGDYTLRTILLDEANGKEASHMSVEKTCNLLKHNYYWPKLTTDVEDFCKTCDVCQRTRSMTK